MHMRPETLLRLLVLSLVLLLAAGHADAVCADRLVGAASDDHLWLVVETGSPETKVSLLHHALAMDRGEIRAQIDLQAVPDAMAAWDDQVWMVFPIEPDAVGSGREVFTLRVEVDPTLGLHVVSPRDRLGVATPLPGQGTLAGFVGTGDGLMALLVPPQWSEASVTARSGAGGDPSALDEPRLLALRNDSWKDVPLPPGLGHRDHWLLAAGGADGRQLTLVVSDADDRRQVEIHTRDADGGWSSAALDLDIGQASSVTRAVERVALVLQTRQDRVRLAYLQPDAVVDLVSFPCPDRPWTVLGMRDGLYGLQIDPSDGVLESWIDPVSGAIGQETVMKAPLPSGSLWYISLLLAATVAALMFVFIVRPGNAAPLTLAEGQQVMPLDQRVIALAMDLFPAAVLTALVLDCSPLDLVRMPLITSTPEQTVPYLIMAGLTIIHTTITEVLTGRSLGKALMGGRVVTIDGARPGPKAIVTRNLLKAFMLAIPPLAVIVVVNPNGQGLGDIIARTIVVRERGDEGDAPAKDR